MLPEGKGGLWLPHTWSTRLVSMGSRVMPEPCRASW